MEALRWSRTLKQDILEVELGQPRICQFFARWGEGSDPSTSVAPAGSWLSNNVCRSQKGSRFIGDSTFNIDAWDSHNFAGRASSTAILHLLHMDPLSMGRKLLIV